MVSRLICLLLVTASCLTGQGLLDKKEEKVVPENVKADRDRYRNTMEVEGVLYPVYLIDEEVKVKRRPKVAIPKQAKKEGRGGVVLIGTIITKTGAINGTAIAMTNAEEDIQQAALKAVRQWNFPIIHNDDNEPIDYVVMVPITVDATPFFGPR